MNCEYCEGEIPPKSNSCPHCGAPCKYFEAENRILEHPIPEKKKNVFLQENTIKPLDFAVPTVAAANNDGEKLKSRSEYIVFGLFLGVFGAHNFYAGYYGKGTIQLLLALLLGWTGGIFLILFFWALLDIVSVKKDAKGRPFS